MALRMEPTPGVLNLLTEQAARFKAECDLATDQTSRDAADARLQGYELAIKHAFGDVLDTAQRDKRAARCIRYWTAFGQVA